MRIRKSYAVVAAIVAAVVIPVIVSSSASAAEDTQSPLQGLDAGIATLQNATESFLDAVNGADRPPTADGTDTEFPVPNVEGPVVGLIQNGPFD